MITKMFTVYDSKAQMYGTPFFMNTTGAAIRAFTDVANDKNTMINKHPGDFVLYEVGSFDDNKGWLVNIDPKIHLGIGTDFKEPEKNNIMDQVMQMPKKEEVLR